MSTEKSKNVVITKKARENLVKARAGCNHTSEDYRYGVWRRWSEQLRYGHCTVGIPV